MVKRVITRSEEFDILKMVLDKVLWLGVILLAFGFYRIVALSESFWYGFSIIMGGAVVLLLFVWILIKEYNYAKR